MQRAPSTGEGYRDNSAAAEALARSEGKTVQNFLSTKKKGDKKQIKRKSTSALHVCSAASDDTVDKLVTVLQSPLRERLAEWLQFGVGLETFAVNGMYEMVSSGCFEF